MAIATLNALETQLFTLLQLSQRDDSRDIQRLHSRMVGVGLFSFCSRCSGSGQYSWNAIDGSRCFGCGGAGQVARKVTPAVISEAKEIVASGKLAAYLVDLQAKQVANRAAKTATKRVMDAWSTSGVSQAYDWRKCSTSPCDREIADLVNKPMCEAYERITKAANALQTLRGTCAKDAGEVAALNLRVVSATAELVEDTERAIQEISSAANLIPIIKAKYSSEFLQSCA
jgi:hypothetical protein